MASRCCCPPESFTPRSPMNVSYLRALGIEPPAFYER